MKWIKIGKKTVGVIPPKNPLSYNKGVKRIDRLIENIKKERGSRP